MDGCDIGCFPLSWYFSFSEGKIEECGELGLDGGSGVSQHGAGYTIWTGRGLGFVGGQKV